MIPFMGETVCRAFNLVFIPVFLLLFIWVMDRKSLELELELLSLRNIFNQTSIFYDSHIFHLIVLHFFTEL